MPFPFLFLFTLVAMTASDNRIYVYITYGPANFTLKFISIFESCHGLKQWEWPPSQVRNELGSGLTIAECEFLLVRAGLTCKSV